MPELIRFPHLWSACNVKHVLTACYFYCFKTLELSIHRLSSPTVPVNKDHYNAWTCSVSAQLSLCVMWRRRIVRNLARCAKTLAQSTTWSRAIGQMNVAQWRRSTQQNRTAWLLQRNLSEMWANCNSDAPHKQGHGAQNMTRYTIWNGVLSIIQSAMVPILICITITGSAELLFKAVCRASLCQEESLPSKSFRVKQLGEVVRRGNNLQGVFWGDHWACS